MGKQMKKMKFLFLGILMMFAITACGGKDESTEQPSEGGNGASNQTLAQEETESVTEVETEVETELPTEVEGTETESEATETGKANIGNRLKLISSKLDGKSADKYLNDEKELEKSAYAENFLKKSKYPKPNESGFDLEDALNPKEDLEEIMKAFDFFVPENNKKRAN